MKCTIPEISWHNREPVLSVDIFPENKDFYRLASGGGDCHVLIWQMNLTQNGAVKQEVISDLTRHQKAVNCVRWSNTGQFLASGDDDSNIIVWQLKTDNIPLLEGDGGDKETWIIFKVMRGHKEDVYDLCWSIDNAKILSGSVDNTAILWDINKGKMDHILSDHKGFVQGVSWDPKNQIIATISTDRICRIFDPFGKQVKARIHKGKLQVSDEHYLKDKEVKFFHDDTFKSFFRRLSFTPDGSLLIVPSGHIEADNCKNSFNATLIFTLDNFNSPAVILPIPRQSSTVVKCCPILFELHEDGPDPIINLPYRMIFAIGTDHDIILYDTQQILPFARFQDIHYTRLTDLAWSRDGLLLIASSTDGFCSLITFEMDELGIPWVKMESEGEENPMDISGCEELMDKDENIDINNKDVAVQESISKIQDNSKEDSKKRPSLLEQWAIKTPKKKKLNPDEKKPLIETEEKTEVIEILDSPVKNTSMEKNNCTKMDSDSIDKAKEISVNKLVSRKVTPLKMEKNVKTVDIVQNDSHKFEEKINLLIPKRIKPKLIEANPSTSKESEEGCSTKNQKWSNEKKNEELESEDDENSSDSDVEALSKEELVELHRASENIKEFFCRVPKKKDSHSDIKPIAVRRKPRENNGAANLNKMEDSQHQDVTTPTVCKHSDAKIIEVRRKPRNQTLIQENGAKTEDKAIIHLVNDYSDAKPIEVRKKPRDQVLIKKNEDKANISSASDNSDVKAINIHRKPKESNVKSNKCSKTLSSSISEKVEKDCGKEIKEVLKNQTEAIKGETGSTICLVDSDDEECNTTPKKTKSNKSNPLKRVLDDGPPKIKVSSLVKKKGTSKTLKKTNALLNFLQKPAGKKAEKKVGEVNTDLNLEGNEARDAWKCDSKQEEKKNSIEGIKVVLEDDDKTEDFCLQLEDSQEASEEEKESQPSEECQGKVHRSDDIRININSQFNKNKNDTVLEHVNMEETAITSSSNVTKTPRRVPLITLASPKSKSKKE